MSKTVDELHDIYRNARLGEIFAAKDEELVADVRERAERAGIAAVIRAVRDEVINKAKAEPYLDVGDVIDVINEILGDAGNEKVAGSTPEGAVLSSSAEGEPPASPATDPAPAPCLWRVHHETRNGPLYVSQCDGEWRHATADPKCPACKKEIFFVTDPAPAVCEWTASAASGLFSARCQPHNAFVRPIDNCHLCGLPIKFTEAKT